MKKLNFANGTLFITDPKKTDGNTIKFAELSFIQLNFFIELKVMHRKGKFSGTLARGKPVIKGYAKSAQINVAIFNDLFFGPSRGLELGKPKIEPIPIFQTAFCEEYSGKRFTLQLNAVTAAKLTFPIKLDDGPIIDLDLELETQPDSPGNVGFFSMSE